MDNNHEYWSQGYFVDSDKYRSWSIYHKTKASLDESLLVRPTPTGNAICKCASPEAAQWIASRLNLAAKLEREGK